MALLKAVEGGHGIHSPARHTLSVQDAQDQHILKKNIVQVSRFCLIHWLPYLVSNILLSLNYENSSHLNLNLLRVLLLQDDRTICRRTVQGRIHFQLIFCCANGRGIPFTIHRKVQSLIPSVDSRENLCFTNIIFNSQR